MTRLAIFASGEGTNAQSFVDYFANSPKIKVSMILSGNEKAKVLERAKRAGIPTIVINKEGFYKTNEIVTLLKQKADFIVLAGFMWMIPDNLLKAFEGKIVNIHPALLPKFGGKGMYGTFVHQAVIGNKEKKSGITIHYVNEHYDEGKIIFQKECEVKDTDTPESLAARIHSLEHKYYPEVVEKLLSENKN